MRCSCQIFSGFSIQKLLKSVNFNRVIQKIKMWTFFYDTVYITAQLPELVLTGVHTVDKP